MTDTPCSTAIELASGRFLDLADPRPEDITLDDVAHGLSQTCRFAGQTRRFYSVAQHAVLVSRRLDATGCSLPIQLGGLHHDDAEAFIGDCTRPLKMLLPGWRRVEQTVLAAIGLALEIGPLTAMESAAIKAADDWALAREAHQLMVSQGAGWWCDGLYHPDHRKFPYDTVGLPSDPATDKRRYLHHHQRLTDALRSTETQGAAQ